MKRANLIFIMLICPIFILCCLRTPFDKKENFTVATFNIEWLGDGQNDNIKRSENDYKNIGELITMINADIIGLQEIENEKAIKRLMPYLADYDYIIPKVKRGQNVACLYKKGILIESYYIYDALEVGSDRLRPGLVIHGKKGNFDWIIKIVHLKSTSRYDDTPEKRQKSIEIRTEQALIINKWVDSVLANGTEKDILVIGDFNDRPGKKKEASLTSLINNPELIFLTDKMKSCKYPLLETIDHIVITHSAKSRYIKNSLRVYDFKSSLTDLEAEMVSDHCPIAASFEIVSPDND